MAGRQAKVLDSATIKHALTVLHAREGPERHVAIFLLSLRAGLRACEIAGLERRMVLAPDGSLSSAIAIENTIAKKGSGRLVPIHAELAEALKAVLAKHQSAYVIPSSRGGGMRPNSIVNWFVDLYREIDAQGCSSHSGRRTFITHAARKAHQAGASIRDVQLLAGHRSIEVTQRYIDGDSDAQRRLVSLL
jgi:integrase